MTATALAAIPPFQMVLFGKDLVSLRTQVIVAFFERNYFSDHCKQVIIRGLFCKYIRKAYLYTVIRIMILVFKHIFPRNYVGLALWPFIVVKDPELKNDRSLMNHERIHLRQQLEMLIVLFYLWYFVEWCYYFLLYGDRYQAYKMISFEREAYRHEANYDYLRTRKPWAFLSYLGRQADRS